MGVIGIISLAFSLVSLLAAFGAQRLNDRGDERYDPTAHLGLAVVFILMGIGFLVA